MFRERSAVDGWRLTLMFLFVGKITAKTPRWGSDLLGQLIKDQDRAAVKANPAPAVFIAEAMELYVVKKYRIPDALKEAFRQLSLDAIEDEINLLARHALGLCLGRVGDPRILGLRDPDAYVEVPAGTYAYVEVLPGNPDKKIEITAFRISRYPVTNGQYEDFLEDGGYEDPRWWSEDGWSWLQKEKVTKPKFWHRRRWNGPNQPVVGVSFWEAQACCAWAGGRLPSKAEWEAIARGGHADHGWRSRAYPWGNDWKAGICNNADAGLRATSAVGLFPSSRQAWLGIEDLVGNVWQWCGGLYSESDPTTDPNLPRLMCGGAWNIARIVEVSRVRYPSARDNDIGFRAVCSFSSPSSGSDH